MDRLSPALKKSTITEIKATTTNGKALISFKPNAFVPGFPIQPVVPLILFLHRGNISLKSLIPQMLLQFHNFMQVHYLPVIYLLSHEKSHPVDYAQRVRYAMARRLNVLEMEHCYSDLLLSARSLLLKCPLLLMQWTTEFLQSLGLTHSPFEEQAFVMFDRKKHEFVTFQEKCKLFEAAGFDVLSCARTVKKCFSWTRLPHFGEELCWIYKQGGFHTLQHHFDSF
ncbi:hypothetical protein SELMODRAFT_424392 [Selaginella moellendorffii]|uniref:Uncharacterized protein n=1 Tax=Selaginella moellendorffii TaxID=88036 RepID=D8SPR0_SELML|nr:hypothetical protein SELMODRAFT_424392 [Selaginella moellendorffii]